MGKDSMKKPPSANGLAAFSTVQMWIRRTPSGATHFCWEGEESTQVTNGQTDGNLVELRHSASCAAKTSGPKSMPGSHYNTKKPGVRRHREDAAPLPEIRKTQSRSRCQGPHDDAWSAFPVRCWDWNLKNFGRKPHKWVGTTPGANRRSMAVIWRPFLRSLILAEWGFSSSPLSQCGSRKPGDWSINVTCSPESTGMWCCPDPGRNPLNQLRSVHWVSRTSAETTWWLWTEVTFWRSWNMEEGRRGVFPDLDQNMNSTPTWEKLSQSSQGGHLSRCEQFLRTSRQSQDLSPWPIFGRAEARSRQTRLPPPDRDNVTEDVGHLEKVEKTTMSAILKNDEVTEDVGHLERMRKNAAEDASD